jgi:hypothetical protein
MRLGRFHIGLEEQFYGGVDPESDEIVVFDSKHTYKFGLGITRGELERVNLIRQEQDRLLQSTAPRAVEGSQFRVRHADIGTVSQSDPLQERVTGHRVMDHVVKLVSQTRGLLPKAHRPSSRRKERA